MNLDEVAAIRGLFSGSMKPYRYFKDQFAIQLASWVAGADGISVSALKRSQWASLLSKEPLKRHSAQHAMLRAADLERINGQTWEFEQKLDYYYSDDSWEYAQVSRPGSSLVLRLDWGQEHTDLIRRLSLAHVMPEFERRNHMEALLNHNFAWARIDLDWETGEALIEEIQTDWLRTVKGQLSYKPGQCAFTDDWYGSRRAWKGLDIRLKQYWDEQLAPLERLWDEMMLSAALDFLRNTMGFYCIYMHTHACGTRLKGIWPGHQPPRSIYEDLPRRFCFQRTSRAPVFLQRSWGGDHAMYEGDVRDRYKRPYDFWYIEL